MTDFKLNRIDDHAALGFDVVWLMGVWERSPAGSRDGARERGLGATTDGQRAVSRQAGAGVSTQAIVADLRTFVVFPACQEVGGFTVDQVMTERRVLLPFRSHARAR